MRGNRVRLERYSMIRLRTEGTTVMKQIEESAVRARIKASVRVSCYAIAALLAGCGGGSSGMGYMAPPPAPTPVAASTSISVAPTTLTVRQSATITWS
jgi:hypothetical protein